MLFYQLCDFFPFKISVFYFLVFRLFVFCVCPFPGDAMDQLSLSSAKKKKKNAANQSHILSGGSSPTTNRRLLIRYRSTATATATANATSAASSSSTMSPKGVLSRPRSSLNVSTDNKDDDDVDTLAAEEKEFMLSYPTQVKCTL